VDFWAEFEQRKNDCGAVSMLKDSTPTRVVTFDTAKYLLFR